MKVRVDPDRCQGHTLCSMIAPDSFILDDIEGHASAASEDVAAEQEDVVREAAHSCPEQAILIHGDRQHGAAGRSGSPSSEQSESTS